MGGPAPARPLHTSRLHGRTCSLGSRCCSFETEEEAIALTNESVYGLGHAVMSADMERCERVAAQLDAGSVWINCNQALFPQTPFGGWKQSGFGKEYGEAGLQEYLRHKTVTTAQHGYSWGYYG